MITIGCAGFPVPATRYFKEFLFVEVQETHVVLPGSGTIRRWKREAPPGFKFAVLSPKEIGQEGFREGKVVETALKSMLDTAKELGATTGVFVAPTDFGPTRPNKTAIREFLASVKSQFECIIWEPPAAWDQGDADAVVEDSGAIASRDPLARGTTKAKAGYYRLPGPAGHKSRYEDPAIEKLAELAESSKNADATYVFTNVDMFADAKRLKKLLRL